jgi:hypothetical protein
MKSVYFIYEKNGKAKLLTVLSAKRAIAVAALRRFASKTPKEVYLLDAVKHKIVVTLKA